MEDKNTEPPAAPAAATKGMSGKQQLDAATTLARAPRLANSVLRLVLVSFTVRDVSFGPVRGAEHAVTRDGARRSSNESDALVEADCIEGQARRLRYLANFSNLQAVRHAAPDIS